MSKSDRKSKRKNREPSTEPFKPVMVDVSSAAAQASGEAPQGDLPPAQTPDAPEAQDTESTETSPEDPGSVATEIVTRDLSADISSLEGDAEFRPWPAAVGRRGTGYQVIIRRSVLNTISRHGKTTSEVEVCGVMVGDVYRDETGPYLYVDACIIGEKAGHSAAQVTFTAETWSHVQGVLENDYPDQRIVGWYHTHPGFGIFLSDMDLFIHGNFFNLPWQIAFVYDPHSGEEGLFVWREGKTERAHFFIEEDTDGEVVTIPVTPEAAAEALADFSRRVQRIERQQKPLWVLVGLLAIVSLAWPFVLYTIMNDKGRPIPLRVQPSQEQTKKDAAAEDQKINTASVIPSSPATQSVEVSKPSDGAAPLNVTGPAPAPASQPATLPAVTPQAEKPAEPTVIRHGTTASPGAKILEPDGNQ